MRGDIVPIPADLPQRVVHADLNRPWCPTKDDIRAGLLKLRRVGRVVDRSGRGDLGANGRYAEALGDALGLLDAGPRDGDTHGREADLDIGTVLVADEVHHRDAVMDRGERRRTEQQRRGRRHGLRRADRTREEGTGTPALVASAMMGDTLALTISTAPSWLRRRRTFEAARAGWPWSSRITSWTWRLLMPPLALRLSTYIFMPLACPA